MITISVTKLQTYLNCPRLFYWENIVRIEPRAMQFPLVVGRIVHEAVDLWQEDPDLQKIQAFIDRETSNFLRNGRVSQQEYDEKLAIVEGMVLGYLEQELVWSSDMQVLASEVPWETTIQLKDEEVRITGRVDRIVRTDRDCWVWELKTRSSIDSTEFDLYAMQYQPRMYDWIFSRGVGEFPATKGVFLQMIRKPSIRRRVKSGESQVEFTRRLKTEYLENPEKYFNSRPVQIPQHLREQFHGELTTLVRDITRKCRRTKDPLAAWPTNPQQCTAFGQCPYLPLCQYGLNLRTAGGFVLKEKHEMEPETLIVT